MTPYALLCELAACLCAELTPDGAAGPGLCFCGVMPGQQPGMMIGTNCEDKCGQAWVRMIAAYPAVAAGVQDENGRNCGTYLGVDIEMGVARCLSFTDEEMGPDENEQAAAVARQSADLLAMRRAVLCCLKDSDIDYDLGIYTPQGPLGGIVGGRWTLSVAL